MKISRLLAAETSLEAPGFGASSWAVKLGSLDEEDESREFEDLVYI